ncbi:SOS response-associated peptidase [Nodularia harveyana UHCC-0300]|uniref:Abasic site processing protein n=1 Tax=Nodularia harveyana UHCC-0300 TaxID=2974287 RepID=A0ABU5UIT2_9CYAN|nr:SOS response-associated peptidase [Nodularia harveyana]MEA5583409.1 SOS response-associated peptidase [Nodularia harveyana UHCC-0300]
MCGRFTLNQSSSALCKFFGIDQIPDLSAEYNIAPTQMVATVRHNPETNQREFQQLRWGLIPRWMKEPGMGVKLINARAETVAEKPAFRGAFYHRRCLVLADGFYEWKRENGKKQPFYFQLSEGTPFGFAGLWEKWQPLASKSEGEEIISCTILTTAANELVKPIHQRMPVILAPQDYDLWLNHQMQTPELLQQLLCPYPDQAMTGYPVSSLVNDSRQNSAECIIPLSGDNLLSENIF